MFESRSTWAWSDVCIYYAIYLIFSDSSMKEVLSWLEAMLESSFWKEETFINCSIVVAAGTFGLIE